jgi:hypothetical protein
MIYRSTMNGLPVCTGDIICTTDGSAATTMGKLWQALGLLVPGEVDHTVLYLGPGGRCVEAGARGVLLFDMPGERWEAGQLAGERWLIDSLVGVAYPLADRAAPGVSADEVRAAVADYCALQAAEDKPYNVNFFDPNTDAAFYCSQLIYKAYREFGLDVSVPPGAPSADATRIVVPQMLWQSSQQRRVSNAALEQES